ncbi:MAG: peptide chain release factor N(5)-glutamine methyltransferase [Patescibacteria group bacterium]|jgi:release factor glutamine methyltransferase
MKTNEALRIAGRQFNKVNIKNPAFEAEILLSYILKKPREFLFSHPNRKISEKQITKFKALVERRKKSEPIAYLTGNKEFYGLNFVVNKNTLIPRPETELMVEKALALTTHSAQHATLIDVGTGSGCIIIALAKLLKLQIKNYELFAIDVSSKALAIAKKNAKFHKVDKQIKFLQGNLIELIIKNQKLKIENQKLIILANLPYLTPAQIKSSLSIRYEPKLALDGGIDGLKYYRKLFAEINVLKRKFASISILCEIDPSQASKIKKLANEFFDGKKEIIKDLSKRNRIFSIVISN